jgi:hypothetical protein
MLFPESPQATRVHFSRTTAACLVSLAMSVAIPARIEAHHAGIYDDTNIVTLAGTIRAVAWVNPHVRITVDAATETEGTSADGVAPAAMQWTVEGTSVNALERWGVAQADLRVGARLSVRGPRSRFDENAMIGAVATLADGGTILLWPNVASRLGLAVTGVDGLFPPPSVSAATPHGASGTARTAGIFRVWTPRGRPSALTAAELPLTDAAEIAFAGYDALRDDPALRCSPPGMPAMLDTLDPVEFKSAADQVIIRYEEWDAVRVVYLRPGRGPAVRPHALHGTSFGRWEGETLAVFTTYIDYPYLDTIGTPQSHEVTVLERYSPSADYRRLDWSVTVTDPATLREPVTRAGFYSYEPGETIRPFNCTLEERHDSP